MLDPAILHFFSAIAFPGHRSFTIPHYCRIRAEVRIAAAGVVASGGVCVA
jgi:hypothetical protein